MHGEMKIELQTDIFDIGIALQNSIITFLLKSKRKKKKNRLFLFLNKCVCVYEFFFFLFLLAIKYIVCTGLGNTNYILVHSVCCVRCCFLSFVLFVGPRCITDSAETAFHQL